MSEVKESKEALVGALLLGSFLYGKFKDGVQVSDVAEIMAKMTNDAEFKAVIEAAYTDAEKIPAELKIVDLPGGLEIVSAVMAAIPKAQAMLAPKAA